MKKTAHLIAQLFLIVSLTACDSIVNQPDNLTLPTFNYSPSSASPVGSPGPSGTLTPIPSPSNVLRTTSPGLSNTLPTYNSSISVLPTITPNINDILPTNSSSQEGVLPVLYYNGRWRDEAGMMIVNVIGGYVENEWEHFYHLQMFEQETSAKNNTRVKKDVLKEGTKVHFYNMEGQEYPATIMRKPVIIEDEDIDYCVVWCILDDALDMDKTTPMIGIVGEWDVNPRPISIIDDYGSVQADLDGNGVMDYIWIREPREERFAEFDLNLNGIEYTLNNYLYIENILQDKPTICVMDANGDGIYEFFLLNVNTTYRGDIVELYSLDGDIIECKFFHSEVL